MKNVIIALGVGLMSVLTILILFTVYGQNTRQNELEDTVSAAVEQTLKNYKISKHYDVKDVNELIADLNQNLILSVESDSELEVRVLAVDTEKGLIDIEVTEDYVQPNKTRGKAVCRKTIVVDEYAEPIPTYCFVTFFNQDEDGNFKEYVKYSIGTGSDVVCPTKVPECKGKTFKGWSLEKPENGKPVSCTYIYEGGTYKLVDAVTGENSDTKLIVSSDTQFYAVYQS